MYRHTVGNYPPFYFIPATFSYMETLRSLLEESFFKVSIVICPEQLVLLPKGFLAMSAAYFKIHVGETQTFTPMRRISED